MIQTRKSAVRWSDSDIEQVWAALPGVIEKNRRRGLTWQIEHAGQVALGPDRWRRIPSFATIPSVLLTKIAERYPELKTIYPQLERVNQVPVDKETFINVVVETRLSQPFTDFVDIWNECIALVPELGLPEVAHSKYIDPDFSRLIQRKCEEWMEPEPEIEPEPVQPKLEECKALDLLTAYHQALMREMQQAYVGKPVAMIDKEVSIIALPPAPVTLPSAPGSQVSKADVIKAAFNEAEATEDGGRQKIRISIVDHNVSRTPAAFEREYAEHPSFKFKFFFTVIGAKDTPTFKQGGYAIVSESAMVSWKNTAMQTCGRSNVYIVNGSRESVRDSMQRIVTILETQHSKGHALALTARNGH